MLASTYSTHIIFLGLNLYSSTIYHQPTIPWQISFLTQHRKQLEL